MDDGPVLETSEYLTRQSTLLSQLDVDSILLIPTNPKQVRTHDVYFPFRPSSDILYLSGWDEPSSLFAAKHNGIEWETALFVQDNDELAERWEGRRVGVAGAAQKWPVDKGYDWNERIKILQNWLISSKSVFIQQGLDPLLDKLVQDEVTKSSRIKTTTGVGPTAVVDPSQMIAEMRMRKSESEISLMRSAAKIASSAHILAMKRTLGDTTEFNLQSIIESTFTINQSTPSYSSIVAGGDNATILHYHKNNSIIESGELVLIDAGCEINGYASDITRTWPVNGKFSPPQKEIYELVLKAQTDAIAECRAGKHWSDPHKAAVTTLAYGLLELGILTCSTSEALGNDFDGRVREFFMHGTSHSLGLDVHDVGITKPPGDPNGRMLEPGMVITVEPGLYFPKWVEGMDFDSKYLGIGIRIEDDVLITDGDPIILTNDCPKTVVDIESTIGRDL